MRFYTREIPSILATAVVTSAIWLISGAVSKIIDDDNNEKPPCCPCVNTKSNGSGKDDPKGTNLVVKASASARPVIHYDSLVENPPLNAFKDPETPEEACAALKGGDLAYFSVGKALKLVQGSIDAKFPDDASFYEPGSIEDLGVVAVTCSLTEDEVIKILSAGIDQGDVDIGHTVMEAAKNACISEGVNSLGYQILRGEMEKKSLEECEPLPPSPYFACMSEAGKCYTDPFEDDGSSEDCFQRVAKKCDGLDDSFSPRSDCESSLNEELRDKLSDRRNQCVSGRLADMGIDPDDVKPLADIKEVKLLAESYKAIFIDEPDLPREMKLLNYIWDLLLSDVDFDNSEVLDALGVSDKDEFIDKYIRSFISSAEEILPQMEDPAYFSAMIEDLKETFGL